MRRHVLFHSDVTRREALVFHPQDPGIAFPRLGLLRSHDRLNPAPQDLEVLALLERLLAYDKKARVIIASGNLDKGLPDKIISQL